MLKSVKKSTAKKKKTTAKKVVKKSVAKKPAKKPAKRVARTKPAKKPTKKAIKKSVKKPAVALQVQPIAQHEGQFIAEQAKFQIGPTQNSGKFEAHNLPNEYGKDRIILLIIDHSFVFTYWEVRPEHLRDGNNRLTLRFCDVNANKSWDVSIYERIGTWYLRLEHPSQLLKVEIGLKDVHGNFRGIASSGTMHMPRNALAARGPIKWMLVAPSGEKIITEAEEYTDADLELLKKILGDYYFNLLRRGRFPQIGGSRFGY